MDALSKTTAVVETWGKILLLGTFAISLIQAIRGERDLSECFERLCISMLLLTFYFTWSFELQRLSLEMSAQLGEISYHDDLKALLFKGMERAAHLPSANGATILNVPALVEQAWRSGVWGIMNSIVEFAFILVDLLIDCGREVLWQIALILFPLACGVYPVLPGILKNMLLYLVELALWTPLLCIVRTTTAAVARPHLNEDGSLGLYIVGVELVAIVLILTIPKVTHRFLSGALSGDLDTHASVIGMGQRVITIAKGGLLK